jgi:hypothetical protein
MLYSRPKKPGVEAFRGLLRGAMDIFHDVPFREDQKWRQELQAGYGM